MQHSGATERPPESSAHSSSPPKNGERIVWLDIARGCSILLVVLFHASITTQFITELDASYWLVNDFFASIRMPLFFAISGMLSRRVLSTTWKELLEKRIVLLFYLYVLWAMMDFGRRLLSGESQSLSDLLHLILWPDPVLWFIWALGFYFIIAKAFSGSLRLLALCGSLALSILVSIEALPVHAVEHSKALNYVFFFLLGSYGAPRIFELLKHWRAVFLVSALAYVSLFLALRWGYAAPFLVSVLSIIGLVTGISGSIYLSRIPVIGPMLAYFGRNTLTIYVTHAQLLKLFVPLLAGIVALPGFSIWGALAVGAVATWLSLALRPLLVSMGATWLYALPGWIRARIKSRGEVARTEKGAPEHGA